MWIKLLITCVAALLLTACSTNEPLQIDSTTDTEEVTAEAKGTVEEEGFIKYRSAEWYDNFNGLESNINSVSVHLDSSAVFVWMTVKNTTNDRKFTTYPNQAKLVTDDGAQYDVNIIESDSIGGEIVSNASLDGDLVFETNYENIRDLTEIRLVWNAMDMSDMTTRDYDIKLQLK